MYYWTNAATSFQYTFSVLLGSFFEALYLLYMVQVEEYEVSFFSSACIIGGSSNPADDEAMLELRRLVLGCPHVRKHELGNVQLLAHECSSFFPIGVLIHNYHIFKF